MNTENMLRLADAIEHQQIFINGKPVSFNMGIWIGCPSESEKIKSVDEVIQKGKFAACTAGIACILFFPENIEEMLQTCRAGANFWPFGSRAAAALDLDTRTARDLFVPYIYIDKVTPKIAAMALRYIVNGRVSTKIYKKIIDETQFVEKLQPNKTNPYLWGDFSVINHVSAEETATEQRELEDA